MKPGLNVRPGVTPLFIAPEGGAEGGGAILPENGRHGGRPRSGVPREENARETADPEKLNV